MFQKLNNAFAMSGSLDKFLTCLTDLVFLNFLCFICCIPIVTLGASISALDAVLQQYLKKEEYSVGRDFFFYFRKNLKRSTVVWGPSLALYAVLGITFQICSTNRFDGRLVVMGMTVCAFVLIFFTDQYSMILLGRTEMKTLSLLGNAFMLSIIGLPYSLILLLLHLIPFVVLWYSVSLFFHTMFIWILFGIAANQLAAVYFYQRILKKLPE